MNSKRKREIRNKARLVCGLVNILQYDADNIVSEANDLLRDELLNTLQDTKITLQNLTDTIAEIEYILYLDKLKES